MKQFTPVAGRLGLWVLAIAVAFALTGRFADALFAQNEAGAAANAGQDGEAAGDSDSEETGKEDKSLAGVVLDGASFGIIFYVVLGIFSIAAATVTFERLAHLRKPIVMPPEFVRDLRDVVARKDDPLDDFRRLAERDQSTIASILKAGVLRAGRPLPEVEKGMEDAAAREMAELRAKNRLLNVVGAVAPLVGLLGTVVGMIFAFQVSSQAGLGKAELLAEGIYLALMTTAAGLTIAIPCLLLVAWFNGRVELFMREIDECLLETMPSFSRMENRVAQSSGNGAAATEPDREPALAGS